MVQKNSDRREQVSPSMIQSFFKTLKSNGYSDDQILALSAGLSKMATRGVRTSGRYTTPRSKAQHAPQPYLKPGQTIHLSGLDELEDLCNAGLPHQM